MKILIDTNIALDILLKRKPAYAIAGRIFSMTKQARFESFISASAVTDIFFIAKKDLGKEATKKALKEFLQIFKPATVTDEHIYQALDLDWSDFEDSVQYVVGESFAADYIVTRNTKDYSSSTIPVVTPEQFIEAIITVDEEESK